MSSDSAGVSIVAVDTGGTFTDVVAWIDGTLRVLKLASTPADPSTAVIQGVRQVLAAADAAGTFILVHGSTVATNALLERRGARVALVTNRGFEDVIEIGRQNRPQLYALVGTRPPPLVARADRHGIAGRLGADGAEIEPLDGAEIDGLADRVADADSIAICLLHSYANDAHEQRVARSLGRLARPVSVSSELLPEFREYERTATTVANAYVSTLMDRYLGEIERACGARRVRVMGSGGGAIPVSRARREAVHTILSGPAGGVIGARAVARDAGYDTIMTFDMGGTSTDVSLCPGRLLHTREFSIAGAPIAIPVLDIHTVGAGGGSIARVDAGGALRVGPESAGAVPGPICYGRGGAEITVTDANVWLRRLPAGSWPHPMSGATAAGARDRGGRARAAAGAEASGRDAGRRASGGLDRDAIEAPLARLAHALGTGLDAAAEGVIAVANAAMEGALRVISVERGYDPADFTMVCFGGAAALHAAELAVRLGVPRVLVPPAPGALSAFGMLVAPVRKHVSRTVLVTAMQEGAAALDREFVELEERAVAAMADEGVAPNELALARRVDARYRGQSFELTVDAAGWVDAFHRAHETRYGYARPGAPVEAVTLRVEALAAGPRVALEPRFAPARATGAAPAEVVPAVCAGRALETPRYDRATLRAGDRLTGPAIISEYTATTWVPPEWEASVFTSGALILSIREGHA